MASMKTLVIQTSFLGDTVLSTPVIEALRANDPDGELWLMTTPLASGLFSHDSALSGVLAFDKREVDRGVAGIRRMADKLQAMKFDRAYGLQRSLRTALLLKWAAIPERYGFSEARGACFYTHREGRKGYRHDVERNLAIMGRATVEKVEQYPLRLVPAPQELLGAAAREFLAIRAPYVALVPGSVWATKRWAWQHYAQVARDLTAQGLRVLILGASAEQAVCSQVQTGSGAEDLCGKTSVSDMVALISYASAIVCNDSFALHVSSAFKRPTVALFCSTVPEFGFGPWANPQARVLEVANLPCKPCGRHGHAACPLATEHCMRGVLPQQVWDALVELGIVPKNSKQTEER